MKNSFDPPGDRPTLDIRCGYQTAAQITDPLSPMVDPDKPSGPDDPFEIEEPDDTSDDILDPAVDDDAKWDVFLPDDDELDPPPDHGDFWLDPS